MRNDYTRLVAALLDTIRGILDHISGKLTGNPENDRNDDKEFIDKSEKVDSSITKVDLNLFARAINTFATTKKQSHVEERKDDVFQGVVRKEVETYEKDAKAMVSEVVQEARLIEDAKAEAYLKANIVAEVSVSEAEVDEPMKSDQSETIVKKEEELNFGDLDSILNFETKEFKELVKSVDMAVSMQKTLEASKDAVETKVESSKDDIVMKKSDQKLSQEFMDKSVNAVMASV